METFIVLAQVSERWELATRTVFESRVAAEYYAASMAMPSLVVSGRFDGLRFGEQRGTAAYWGAR